MAATNAPDQGLHAIRLPYEHVAALIEEGLARAADAELAKLILNDRGLHVQAVDMVQRMTILTSMAQTLKPDVSFPSLLIGVSLSNGKPELERLALPLMDIMQACPRLPDTDLDEEVVSNRMRMIAAAI